MILNMGLKFSLEKELVALPDIKYGRLYNWYAASNALFAPVGWHVPTQAEWETLLNYIDTYDSENDNWPLAGGKLKEIGLVYWDSPNEGATNEYNLNLKGAGQRGNNFEFLNYEIDFQVSETEAVYVTSDSSQIGFYTLSGGNLGNAVIFLKNDSVLVPSLTDLDGNIYRATKIGNQVWLADNWACTKLNDGTPIPNVTDNAEWAALTTGAYCNYDNDINNVFL